MLEVIKKLSEVNEGEVGIVIYSPEERNVVASFNSDMGIPLASSGKIAIGFVITKWVMKNQFSWDEIIEDIRFDEHEDSHELYPHLQGMNELTLRNAVEVMIASHDNHLAKRIVSHCGGWDLINEELHTFFHRFHLTQDPLDINNAGNINELFLMLNEIYEGYIGDASLWEPLMNGLVRQRSLIEGIPSHHLNHMTGGLPTVLVHLGIIGEFHNKPLLYVIGVKDVPNRSENQESDQKVVEALQLMYKFTQ
ncbi:serine hydrolase [Pseudalkalibacillus berkeleyi]|uniref:Class A beta-lactamase-related serine hydrolase n=1 Tax=Pseudalkalibacillus berkeleyi TaxID=1069813 RepID=A0ABS9GZU4_9BACL|nr:serine hydrolase [Pseudalkalibacillus berkeleyi]MCF6138267.1 class A beta-lactamase-related serine hydrolase [Pseudalkalibacillus berkeleyi]